MKGAALLLLLSWALRYIWPAFCKIIAKVLFDAER